MAELRGRRKICKHTGHKWPTIEKLLAQGFPAVKIGRDWVSDTEEIARWKLRLLRRREE